MSEKRQPKGTPVGGQFAESAHDEAPSSLGSGDPSDVLYETTFIEKDGSLLVSEDGEVRDATREEQRQYEQALGSLDEDEFQSYVNATALSRYLDVPIDEVEGQDYEVFGLQFYETGSEEWMVGDEDTAKEAARSKVKEDVWACRAGFLSEGTGISDRAISAIQESMYEDASEPLQKIVDATWDGGIDGFADDVIKADGRGHTLSGYDGEERRQSVTVRGSDREVFLYRHN